MAKKQVGLFDEGMDFAKLLCKHPHVQCLGWAVVVFVATYFCKCTGVGQ